ncbi:hypothetical protein ABZY02_13780 [Streptomyces sp. NPDC006649]|uniref:hypothetical protein n=1 Tax=Streptomyces sp. NPDC006649 TaxID=3156896 RepID=UPI0033B8E228
MARRTPTIAAALAVSAALLLTACGGSSDDASKDKIKGADEGTKSASPNPSGSGTGKPDLSLPKDVKLDISWNETSDPEQQAALRGVSNYLRAFKHGLVKQDPDDPAYKAYAVGPAAEYTRTQIKQWVAGGWTPTGTDRFYKSQTKESDSTKAVVVTFCRNQSKAYGRSVKTGKVYHTKESLDSYQLYQMYMKPSKASSETWQAQTIQVFGKAKQCQQ